MQSYDHYPAPFSAKGKEPTATTTTFAPRSMPSQPFEYFKKRSERRPPLSRSTFTGPQTVLGPSRSAGCFLSPEEHDRRNAGGSNTTWASSSADLSINSEIEELDDDREEFVLEYNKLAKQYGIRQLVRGDFPDSITSQANASKSLPNRRGSWISRVLRQDTPGTLPQGAITNPDQRTLRHRRSISDATLNIIHQPKKDGLKDEDLTALVRLCGKSILYLPTEYAPCSLVLPTCFRALAQALVQKADSPGIFRVPGSLRVVNALYDYYCTGEDADVISSTTRCPTLPTHIKCGVHDIASTFKRFLAGLPGGILGSLSLFDALVAIHSQFHGDPELNRTKETKLRARLIALAIGTVRSRYQRELICSVFGLLCLAGRAAENAPREDEDGRPLPTADLMGYNALGIVFGPLLIGGLINSYSMKVADPSAGLVLLPVTPPRSRKDRKHKKTRSQIELAVTSQSVDKIHIANSITEMLITNWRDVVRHMRNLGSLKTKRDSGDIRYRVKRGTVRSSASDSFPVGNPLDWNHPRPSTEGRDTAIPPEPAYPPPSPKIEHSKSWGGLRDQSDSLSINQQCSRPSSSESSPDMLARISKRVLSPTAEESPSNNRAADDLRQKSRVVSPTPAHCVPSSSGPIYAPRTSSPPSKPIPTNENDRPATNDVVAMDSVTKSSGSNHSAGDVEQWRIFQPSSTDPKDSSPIQVQTNPEKNLGGPIPAQDGEQESSKENTDIGSDTSQLIQPSDQLAGRRPLRYARSSELNRSSTALQLVQSKGVDEVSRYNKRLFDKQDHPHSNTYERVIGLREKASSAQPLPEGHSYHSSLEEFPRYRESTLDLGNINNSKLLSAPALELIPKSTNSVAKRRSFVIHRRHPSKEILAARKPPSPSVWYSNKLDSGYFDMPVPKETPLEKWKALAEAGRASTDSLAKSAKERRLRRNTIYGVPRQSRDTFSAADNKQMAPEWKTQPVDQRAVEKQKPLPLSPERKSIFEGAPSSPDLKGTSSPSKAKTPPRANASRPLSYRSASRPVDGAVKAMAALFDTTVKDLTTGQGAAFTGRTQGGLRGSKSGILPLPAGSSPPAKSSMLMVKPIVHTPTKASDRANYVNYSSGKSTPTREPEFMVNRTHLRHRYSRSAVEGSPTKFPCISLRPTGGLTAARKVPQTSPGRVVYQRDQELSRPPSLGTMVPHSEAPPVAQHMNFLRPSPSPDASPRARNTTYECLTPHNGSPRQNTSESPRPTSGNSLLHSQICNLQRHLQTKNEEIFQLRRQLETRENVDIGTISEQLRKAKRECKMWRDRAEAAEKRIAVFERFTSRMRGLKETGLEGSPSSQEAHDNVFGVVDNNSSPCSVHTENQDALEERMRDSFKKSARIGGVDGMGREDDEEVFGTPPSRSLSGHWRKSMPAGGVGGGIRLWDPADELLDLDVNTRHWGALEPFESRLL